MRSLILLFAILACVYGSSSRQQRKTQLRNRITRGTDGDCSFISTDGSLEIHGKGNSGQVQFTRNVPKLRGSGTTKKSVWVFPYFLREYDPSGNIVRRAGGFNSQGTAVTWNCSLGTETTVDASGNTVSVDVLQSDWSASREIWTGVSAGVRQTQTVKLGFNVRLFAQTWVLDLCPRKYNGTGWGRGAFWNNSVNCSAVEVPGGGLKWSILVENWPYRNTANHLELGIRIKLQGRHKSTNKRRAKRTLRRRRQAALQIVNFGEGDLENPEEVQEVCPGGTTDRPVVVTNEQIGRSAQVDVRYKFPAVSASGCNFYYDPVMTMSGSTNSTNGVRRSGGLSFVVVAMAAIICGML